MPFWPIYCIDRSRGGYIWYRAMFASIVPNLVVLFRLIIIEGFRFRLADSVDDAAKGGAKFPDDNDVRKTNSF